MDSLQLDNIPLAKFCGMFVIHPIAVPIIAHFSKKMFSFKVFWHRKSLVEFHASPSLVF